MTRGRFFMGVCAVVFLSVLDVCLKWLAILHAGPANAASLPAVFAFALHKNPGIAFDIPVPFFVILPLTLFIIILFGAYFGRRAFIEGKYTEALGCTMVCLGALGNFLDRVINDFTTDYFIIGRTSAINISDVLILVGMVLFLWYHKSTPRESTI
jgi:lipoprotein signal peptidase